MIPSRKRSKNSHGLLLYKGYTYSVRNLKKGGTYWTCSSHHKKGCKANLTTDESMKPNIIIKLNTHHNHPPPVINLQED